MKMVKLLINVPRTMKQQLDGLKQEGYTASGFIRHLLEQHFSAVPMKRQKGR